MNYWIDLFTGTTWEEFIKNGATVSGFRHRMRNTVRNIPSGDILLCYVTGVMRWIGALEVVGQSKDTRKIWEREDFPERLEVRPIIMLKPENSIPMEALEGLVDFYKGPEDQGKFKGFVRGSPRKFIKIKDGELILKLLRKAEKEPEASPVDPSKWARKPLYRAKTRKGHKTVETLVSIPEREDEGEQEALEFGRESLTTEVNQHTNIQYQLIQLGAEMGFGVWVARNDRSKEYKGKTLQNLPNIINELPTQFDNVTNKVIGLIDILWLRGNQIVAAFEIECTTSVYSGLLRMSDLLALQPNIKINIFLIAPETRRDKVRNEILRPTFRLRERPLSEICGFISIEELKEKIEGIKRLGLISSIKADFLNGIAEYFTEETEI
jgi:hypothetical protein